MENKDNFFVLGIVGLVALIGIIVIISSGTRNYDDNIGQATRGLTQNADTTLGATKQKVVDPRYCYDSDFGKTYYKKGYIEYSNGKIEGYSEDLCVGSILKEYYCYKNYSANVSYTCPYGCEDGACKNQTPGNLFVWSDPLNATVYVDNITKGITPLLVTGLKAGSHNVLIKKVYYKDYKTTARIYSGQTTNISVKLTPINQTTNKWPIVSIVSPKNGANYIYPSYITILANASDQDGYITRVEFYASHISNNSGSVGFILNDTSYPYGATFNPGGIGKYTLTAKAFDNLGASATAIVTVNVVNQTINKPPTLTLVSPPDGRSYPINTTVNVIANASDPDGYIRQVIFGLQYSSTGNKSGGWGSAFPDITPPYQTKLTLSDLGTYTITATAYDNLNSTSSQTVRIYSTSCATEICGNAIDDDCDGVVDEGCKIYIDK